MGSPSGAFLRMTTSAPGVTPAQIGNFQNRRQSQRKGIHPRPAENLFSGFARQGGDRSLPRQTHLRQKAIAQRKRFEARHGTANQGICLSLHTKKQGDRIMAYKRDTICVQGGYRPASGESRIPPIVQSTTFRFI